MNSEAIKSSIQSLQQIYSVVLALSLGEAFRQVIVDDPDTNHRRLDRSKFLSLVSLLALIIPFLHGMNRYLFDVYIDRTLPRYGAYLLVDCIAFTLEASLFFVLARSLSRAQWRRFYMTVVTLLSLDIFWGGFIWYFHTPSVKPWVLVNTIFAPLIFLISYLNRAKDSRLAPLCCASLVVSRSICDYLFSWGFYFPTS
jgi:hypothetical protein